MSDREYIMRVALDVIGDQQSYTKVHSDKENLVYLLGFNDGILALLSAVQDRSVRSEEDI